MTGARHSVCRCFDTCGPGAGPPGDFYARVPDREPVHYRTGSRAGSNQENRPLLKPSVSGAGAGGRARGGAATRSGTGARSTHTGDRRR